MSKIYQKYYQKESRKVEALFVVFQFLPPVLHLGAESIAAQGLGRSGDSQYMPWGGAKQLVPVQGGIQYLTLCEPI